MSCPIVRDAVEEGARHDHRHRHARTELPDPRRVLPRRADVPARPGRAAQGRSPRRTRGAEARRKDDRADLREGLDAHALRVRGGRVPPGRARDVPRPHRVAHRPQGDGQGHGTRARPHVRRDRVPRVRRVGRRRARPLGRCARLQRAHRRVAPDADPGRLPDAPRARRQSRSPMSTFCYVGDAHANMADSYLVGGAKMGMDLRIASPRALWPRDEFVDLARRSPTGTGATITITRGHQVRRRRGGRDRDRRVGVDGRARAGLDGAHRTAQALPGQRRGDGA